MSRVLPLGGFVIAGVAAWHVRAVDDAVIAAFFAFAGGLLAGSILGAEFVLGGGRRP